MKEAQEKKGALLDHAGIRYLAEPCRMRRATLSAHLHPSIGKDQEEFKVTLCYTTCLRPALWGLFLSVEKHG